MGVVMSEEFLDKMAEMEHVSECLMMVKLAIGDCLINIISGYMPQVG